jgi:hypothetical protein
MWIAWFNWRFPRSDSRRIDRPPDSNSIGAVPAYAAKWSRLANRSMSRAWPMTIAATTGHKLNQAAMCGLRDEGSTFGPWAGRFDFGAEGEEGRFVGGASDELDRGW